MDLPRNAHRYLYLLEAGGLARDPNERDRLSADWSPDERRAVAVECREKARLYAEEADRLHVRTVPASVDRSGSAALSPRRGAT